MRVIFSGVVAILVMISMIDQCLGQGYNRNYRSQQTVNRHSMNYQNAPGFVPGGGGGGGGVGMAAGGANIVGGLSHLQSATERRYTGGEMLKFMNLEQDPCADFYDYACGNWLQVQNMTDVQEGELITLPSLLERKVVHQLQRRLDNPAVNPHPVVNKFYRTCLSTNWNEEKLFIKRFVANYGGLPDIKDTWRERSYQWIEILARLKLDYNLDILIAFSTAPNTGRPVVREPSSTIMPAELCNAEASPQIDEEDDIFETIQMEIKEKLQLWFNFAEADATRLAGDIQRFEFDLCKFMRKDDILEVNNGNGEEVEEVETDVRVPLENPTNYGANKTPRRLGRSPQAHHFRRNQKLMELESNQKLINFVQLCMGQPQGQGRTDFEIHNPEYLQYLTSISGRKPSFANYIIYRALSEITLPQIDRKPYCVRKVMQVFPEYMGNLYQMTIPAQMREYVKQDVVSIFRDIKEAIPRSLRKNIDTLQISEPTYQVGGVEPNSYTAIKTNGNYWDILKSITISNALQQQALLTPGPQRGRQAQQAMLASNIVQAFDTHMASNEKTLQFGWGLLQPPFYSYNYPKSLKYSSLGYTIARVLIKHYIDEQFSPDKSHQPFTSSHFDDLLSQQRECFRSQVSSYFFNTPEVFRNASQLKDFMADSTALSIAFVAYNNWLDKQDVGNADLKFETLPKMNFSNTQLFFVNFAQMRCADRYSKEPAAEPSQCCPLDLHTPERLNINGPLSNDEEFGLDFNCPIGADMNLADKCSILESDFRRNF
ncbi:endothelin-converting enzyme homolog [Musca vetustissima]|uniref:endothelin-converting enzyme homolog n=1 Tax=Musca vetustissima TaxID=27455 RepID=UPI002AB728DA|nr:endothelin-converting enzyme homolog [Musca vetustissima]